MGAPQTTPKNIVLGAGYLYFDEEDASGNLTGEKYMAETDGFTLAVSTEKTEIDSSDTPVAETLVSLVKKITRSGGIVTKNMDDATFARFVQGDEVTVTQVATPVSAEPLNYGNGVVLGGYYQLGASASNPTGVQGVTAVALKGAGGTPTYVEGTDYVEYLDDGKVFISTGGAISAGDIPEVDYTPVANTRTRIESTGDGAKRGAVYFKGDNTNGENRRVYIPKAELAANGDLAFKDRDNAMTATFDMNILTKDGYAQVYVDGVPV